VKRWIGFGLLLAPGLGLVAFFGFGRPVGRESGDRIVEPFERLAESAAHLQHRHIPVSDEQENEYGRRLAARMQNVDTVDPSWVKYVQRVGNALTIYVRRKAVEYEFHVLDTDVVNAYSLPGGKIYITRGMLSTMQSESELAAILGHEIGHVDLYHCVGLIRTKIARAETPIDDFIRHAHGEAQETEADLYGLDLIVRAGYDPRAPADLFTRMADDGSPEPHHDHRPVPHLLADAIERYERTHPPFRTRIDRLERAIAELPARRVYCGYRNFKERVARIEKAYESEFKE
jgi:predicted Zn-dependent protease